RLLTLLLRLDHLSAQNTILLNYVGELMCQQTLPFSGLWIVSAFSKVDVRAMREGECADLTAHFIRIRVVMDTNVPEVAAELFFHFLAHVILHGLAPLLARHDLLFDRWLFCLRVIRLFSLDRLFLFLTLGFLLLNGLLFFFLALFLFFLYRCLFFLFLRFFPLYRFFFLLFRLILAFACFVLFLYLLVLLHFVG